MHTVRLVQPLVPQSLPTPLAKGLGGAESLLAARPQDTVRFGHGDGDHFHPMPPYEVYGTSNPFFKPLVADLLKRPVILFPYGAFVEKWITHPEVDGLNNLKSLHVLLSRDGLAQAWESLPTRQKPGGVRLALQKGWVNLLARTPLKSLHQRAETAYQKDKAAIVENLHQEMVRKRVFPLVCYDVLKNPATPANLRTEAARILLWDYIANYEPGNIPPQPGEDYPMEAQGWGRQLSTALKNIYAPTSDPAVLPKNLNDLAKVMTSKAIAWPHDAYWEAHDHDHDHDHGEKPAHGHHHHHHHAPKPEEGKHTHGHDHSQMITIHRQPGWDAPKGLSPELGDKLLKLPGTESFRPLIQTLLSEAAPSDWAEQLYRAIVKPQA